MKSFKRPVDDDDKDFERKGDFKYINLKKLIFKTILRGFADWKANIINLFIRNLFKFRLNFIKFITAQQYIDGKAKIL